MEKVFNKLVRDKIPEIIENKGEKAFTKILNEEDYKKELFKKLNEECLEVLSSSSNEEMLEELSDVLEVLCCLAKLENKTLNDIIEIANKKRENRGGFDKKIFLIKKVINDIK